jgi:protease IV
MSGFQKEDGMKKIWRFLVGLFAVIGVLTAVLLGVGGHMAFKEHHAVPQLSDNIVVTLDFQRPLVGHINMSPFDLAFADQPLVISDVIAGFERAAKDKRVKAVIARFGYEHPEWASIQEVRDAVRRFQSSQKPNYAYGENFGDLGQGPSLYYWASAFDQLWLQPVGQVGLSGLMIEMPFAKTALAGLGIKADFIRKEDYKSAMDSFLYDETTGPVRENYQQLLQAMAGQLTSDVAAARGIEQKDVESFLAAGPFTAAEALQLNLIDKIAYADELEQKIKKDYGEGVDFVDVQDYLALSDKDQNLEPKATVAVIYAAGMIQSGESDVGGFAGETIMGGDTIAGAFYDAAEDKDVKAILLRLDSPGGSPAASETIRRAMVKAKEAGKYVVVSMSNVAASGGYWVAMEADKIVAMPGTITGSIGVIAGKFSAAEAFKKLGIGWSRIEVGQGGGMWSPTTGFSEKERARLNVLVEDTYRTFQQSVMKTRKISADKIAAVTGGRVFTGADAKTAGLVDELGGMKTALGLIRTHLALAEDAPLALLTLPAPEDPFDQAFSLLKNFGVTLSWLHQIRTQVTMIFGTGIFGAGVTTNRVLFTYP